MKRINQQCIESIRIGDDTAFAQLYDAYYTYLNTIAINYLYCRNDANEVTNDVFLNLWRNRQNLEYPIHSYMVRSVQNGCLNFIRNKQTYTRVVDEYSHKMLQYQESCIHLGSNPLKDLELSDILKYIKEFISTLPERCREVFNFYFFDQLSPIEISETLQISVNTVRVQIKRALDKLKEAISHLIFLIILFL